MHAPDSYDKAIEYLTSHPEKIEKAWESPGITPGGILFRYCKPDGTSFITPDGHVCGCLSQVRAGMHAWSDDLTNAIRADVRLPCRSTKDGERITVEHLPIFAEWQRRLDKELGRVAPEFEDYA